MDNESEFADSLIAKLLMETNIFNDRLLRGIEKNSAFCRIIRAYVRASPEEAKMKTEALVSKLGWIAFSVIMTEHGFFDIRNHKAWNERIHVWAKNKEDLADLLQKAAALIDAGQIKREDISLGNYKSFLNPEWNEISSHLKTLSTKVLNTNVESIFPVAIPPPHLFSDIGTRGRAADPKSAFRATACREVAKLVPEIVPQRYATIANVLTHIQLDINHNYVRSLLKGGRT